MTALPAGRSKTGGGDGRSPSLRGYQAALRGVDRIQGLRTVAAPGSSALPALADDVRAALIAHAARSGRRSCVLLDPDPSTPPASARALAAAFDAPDAALYYPWIAVRGPTGGRDLLIPPSGAVAGILARVAAARGLHRAPGNEPIQSATGLERTLGAAEAEALNTAGVSALRRFPARGIRVWGARTLSSDPEWRYLNVRRYFAYVEITKRNHQALWREYEHVAAQFPETFAQRQIMDVQVGTCHVGDFVGKLTRAIVEPNLGGSLPTAR